jgi:lytic murein transglycosylase
MAFGPWLDGVRAEAAAQGVSQRTIAAALDGDDLRPVDRRPRPAPERVLPDLPRVRRAHGEPEPPGPRRQRISEGIRATFQRIEQQWGVPGPVIAAFWGLETDYGANIGDLPTINSLVAMAYDCRRPERFRGELIAALKIIERGDLSPHEMVGPWAGELGQLQFLPSHYYTYAVDFDGDGRRDLVAQLGRCAGFGRQLHGRHRLAAGEPWLEEVRVPANLPWEEADIAITHPRAQWAQWGVTRRTDGAAADAMPASLLLPMGRNGPAFLAYPNYHVFLEWNESFIYATTVAYFATRLAGAPRVAGQRPGREPFGFQEIKQLQELLVRRGYDVGGIDGMMGAMTRAAVKAVPAPARAAGRGSYPTPELVARLR